MWCGSRTATAVREPRATAVCAAAALIGLTGACSQAPQPVQPKPASAVEAAAVEGPPAAAAVVEQGPGSTAAAPGPPASPSGSGPSGFAGDTPASGAATESPSVLASAPSVAGQAAPAATGQRPGVVVLDAGEAEDRPKTLVEAARAERERRTHAGKSTVVINDKTLPHLAKGQLTYAQPKKEPANQGTAAGAADEAADKGEAYWRSGVREIRARWHDAVEDAGRLEQSAADLRRRFYAEDDPYRRDVQIKPEWDRALDQLARAREDARAAQRELEQFLEEGRREGALPGWLREGSELEPAPAPAEKPAASIEPPEAQESGAIEPPELGEGPP
jgi:hypothetical protein